MKNSIALCLLLSLCWSCSKAPETPKNEETAPLPSAKNEAEKLVQKALKFHDPKGMFDQVKIECNIRTTTPKDTVPSMRNVSLHTQAGTFRMSQLRDGKEEVISLPAAEQDSIATARATNYQNYFRYMLGGAMVLADESALIQETVIDTVMNGKAAKQIKVLYEPVDKNPVWYFIFDAQTGEMLQNKFVVYEGSEDEKGEFIDYGPYVEYKGMKITSQIVWYYLNGDLLATEKVEYL